MPFLKRSRSHMVQHEVRGPGTVEHGLLGTTRPYDATPTTALSRNELVQQVPAKSRSQRRTSLFGRPKSADERKSIDSRPRTGSKVAGIRVKMLSSMVETIDISTGGDTFRFPTPSPRLQPHKSQATEVAPSPLRMASGSPRIGIAIGSPSQVPPTWGRSYTTDRIVDRLPPTAMLQRRNTEMTAIPQYNVSCEHPKPPELRRKKSSWKTFGALFQKKPATTSASEPFYKVQLPVQPVARPLIDTPSPSPGPARSPGSINAHHKRTPSITRGIARFEARAEADRQSFWPNIESKMHQSPRASQQVVNPQTATVDHANPTTNVQVAGTMKPTTSCSATTSTHQSVPRAVPTTPKLDLDIPNGELERYSVMFEKLLEPKKQSILERRQSKIRRIPTVQHKEQAITTTIAEATCESSPVELRVDSARAMLPLQRSATSPHLKNVPSLRINVFDKNGLPKQIAPTTQRPRLMQRSKTAPSGAVSPIARNFSRKRVTDGHAATNPDVSPALRAPTDDISLPPTPDTFQSVQETSAQNDRVLTSLHDSALRVPRSAAATRKEPGTSAAAAQLSPRSVSGQGGNPLYPRVRSPEDLERQIMQVSVARQVSVNKARSRVQRAVESKQPLRPRVVELQKNRQSTHVVVIEGGEC
ncbi:hypothetical protein BAUCODRAFT_269916 [Baudoinia panamericana UAMH 10762]|uniref:Uncharacterized protein n=1 Tax=Baudoinia panamericana (strain UAMH 10762) TaxID=717646 RepID=M2M9E5_BAUPA|nr:uncharacterized protein BAUCODRAFT_269916 [Baudoinia panamericana UAMH 10762]EMC93001.1 hypothetical protein BAUCODRAFT_269916 [Baudoinia panamericana UAMH 10762]